MLYFCYQAIQPISLDSIEEMLAMEYIAEHGIQAYIIFKGR